MARSMLSLGMLTWRALSMAYRSLRFIEGSPPPWRAAMMIARLSLLQSLPRLASMAPFLCLMVAQWECPDMAPPSVLVALWPGAAHARAHGRHGLVLSSFSL